MPGEIRGTDVSGIYIDQRLNIDTSRRSDSDSGYHQQRQKRDIHGRYWSMLTRDYGCHCRILGEFFNFEEEKASATTIVFSRPNSFGW